MKLMVMIMGYFLATALAFAKPEAVVDVTLNPMGSFKAKTAQVKGHALAKGDQVQARNIVVNLTSLETGVALRDSHTKKYLKTSEFPEAVLLTASGQKGQGKGRIKIKGIEKDIQGRYKINGSYLTAEFPLKLADFDIKDINYMGVGVEDTIHLRVVVPVKRLDKAP